MSRVQYHTESGWGFFENLRDCFHTRVFPTITGSLAYHVYHRDGAGFPLKNLKDNFHPKLFLPIIAQVGAPHRTAPHLRRPRTRVLAPGASVFAEPPEDVKVSAQSRHSAGPVVPGASVFPQPLQNYEVPAFSCRRESTLVPGASEGPRPLQEGQVSACRGTRTHLPAATGEAAKAAAGKQEQEKRKAFADASKFYSLLMYDNDRQGCSSSSSSAHHGADVWIRMKKPLPSHAFRDESVAEAACLFSLFRRQNVSHDTWNYSSGHSHSTTKQKKRACNTSIE